MQGLSALLRAGGNDVTFRALAQASGVPERTLYRYYPSKDALLAAFWTWLNERLGMPPPPRSPDELIESIEDIFAAFASDEPLIRAMLHDPHGRATRLAHAKARRARLRNALQPVLAPLDAATRKRLIAAIHVLVSAAGWETMQDYGRVTSQEAAEASQWAVATLIAEAGRLAKASAASSGRKQKKV